MAAEVHNSKEAESQLPEAKIDNQAPEKNISVGIAACDVGSLLDQFLEYEEKQVVDQTITSSVSLTPVTSPSGRHPNNFTMPEFKRQILSQENGQVQADLGLTPPVSPPSNTTVSPHSVTGSSLHASNISSVDSHLSAPMEVNECDNNECCTPESPSELCNVKDEDIESPSELCNGIHKDIYMDCVDNTANDESLHAIQRVYDQSTNAPDSASNTSSDSCVIEKSETIPCEKPEVDNMMEENKIAETLKTQNTVVSDNQGVKCNGQNNGTSLHCGDQTHLEERKATSNKWSKNVWKVDEDESDGEDRRFNPRDGEKNAQPCHRRKRSPDPYASSDSEDERDRIRWKEEKERRQRCQQRYRRRRSCSRGRSREPSYSRESSQIRESYRSRSHRSRSRSRSRSRQPSRSRESSQIRESYRSRSHRSRSNSRGRSHRSRSRSRETSQSRESYRGYERSKRHRRSRSNERTDREKDLNGNSRGDLYDIEQERKKTFRVDRNFKEASREERRIVYVGRISMETERDDVWRRFRKYGPIEKVTVHYRDEGDNYAFVTFVESASALEAVENANSDPKEPELDICFGGRRKFCGGSYVDFDSNTSKLEEKHMFEGVPQEQSAEEMDFDALLRMAMKKTKG